MYCFMGRCGITFQDFHAFPTQQPVSVSHPKHSLNPTFSLFGCLLPSGGQVTLEDDIRLGFVKEDSYISSKYVKVAYSKDHLQ